MNRRRMVWLVAYDIRDPVRLRKVHKTVRGYGDPLQYSVFRCVLSDRQMAELKARLTDHIHHGEDQVLFVPLGDAEAARTWRYSSLGVPVSEPERVAKIF